MVQALKGTNHSLKHYEYSIEVKKGLNWNVGKDENWKEIEIESRFERWIS
jgi:hypothetical protein